jgi:hypothetical protein
LIDKLRVDRCIAHLDLRSAYNQDRMSDVGPTSDSIGATTFQGFTSTNGAPWKCWLWDLTYAMRQLLLHVLWRTCWTHLYTFFSLSTWMPFVYTLKARRNTLTTSEKY